MYLTVDSPVSFTFKFSPSSPFETFQWLWTAIVVQMCMLLIAAKLPSKSWRWCSIPQLQFGLPSCWQGYWLPGQESPWFLHWPTVVLLDSLGLASFHFLLTGPVWPQLMLQKISVPGCFEFEWHISIGQTSSLPCSSSALSSIFSFWRSQTSSHTPWAEIWYSQMFRRL